jgi:hypothetical protein
VLEIFLFVTSSLPLWLAHPPIQRLLWAFPSLVKRPEREAQYSFSYGTEVDAWRCISSPSSAFMAWCLVKGTIQALRMFLKFNPEK